MEYAGKTKCGKLLIRDEIGTFERKPNENVTESASSLKAKFFFRRCYNFRGPILYKVERETYILRE